MLWTFQHWGFVLFSMYCGAGVMVAFAIHNMNLPYRCSSAIYPLIGDKIYGKMGAAFEALILFAIVCSISSSLGMGALQISSGLEYAFGIKSTVLVAVTVIVIMGILYTLVALTPVAGGMKRVGNFNMILYIFLLLFVFLLGPTHFLIENIIASFGKYLQNIPTLSTNWDPYQMDSFVESWTAYFWPWWLAACAPTGVFLVRLAKGHTLREFVAVNLIFPSLFCIIWMGVFGGTGMYLDIFKNAGIGAAIVASGKEAATYELMKTLPASGLTILITLICAAISFNTKATAVSYTLASSTMEVKESGKEPPKVMIAFWGIAMAVLTAALMFAGGKTSLNNTQTASVICGLPVSILLVIMGIGFFKQMWHCRKYDKVGTFDDPRYFSIVAGQENEGSVEVKK
jgi:glycine betaine transporter